MLVTFKFKLKKDRLDLVVVKIAVLLAIIADNNSGMGMINEI